MRVGQFELDLPFTQARSINISPYDIYTEANIAVANQQNPQAGVNNLFALSDAARGIEFSGGHLYKGYRYSLAIVDQNTSGGSSSSATNVASPPGGQIGAPGLAFSRTPVSRISTPTSPTDSIWKRTLRAAIRSRRPARVGRVTIPT